MLTLMVAAAVAVAAVQASTAAMSSCAYDGRVSWDGPRAYLVLLPCNETDPHQRWQGPTLLVPAGRGGASPSVITNSATGDCLSTVNHDPVQVVPCAGDGSRWVYNATNMTISVATAAAGTLVGKGVGACVDIMSGTGPNVDIWTCHPAGGRPAQSVCSTCSCSHPLRSFT